MSRTLYYVLQRSGYLREIVRLGVIVILSLILAGVSPRHAIAQNGDAEPADRQAKSDTLPLVAYMPAEALAVMTARPREILTDPAAQTLRTTIQEFFSAERTPGTKVLRAAGIVPMKMEAVAVGAVSREKQGRPMTPPVYAIRLTEPVNRKAIAEAAERESVALGGIVYVLDELGTILIPDERTVLIVENDTGESGTEGKELLEEMVLQGATDQADSFWLEHSERFGEPLIGGLINANAIEGYIQKMLKSHHVNQPVPAVMQAVVMLHDLQWAGAAARREESPNIVAHAEAASEEAAERLAKKLRGLTALGLGTVRQLRQRSANRKGQETKQPSGLSAKEKALKARSLEITQTLLASVNIERKGKLVTLTANTGKRGPITIATVLVLPAVQAAREAARRAASKNNLKHLGLAFHNYHSAHGYFPPAVIEKNGVAHSWRVAILPFLEQGDLYERYHFDEPWNSEHNKKLIPLMPKVYRDPSDQSQAHSASYFLLTSEIPVSEEPDKGEAVSESISHSGTLTLFTDEPIDLSAGARGPKIADIVDGTSNTILVVEASQDIPWTKPEDIPFDPEKIKKLVKKELGGNHPGGFQAAFADGSVHFLSENINGTTLGLLIMPADGQAIGLGK